MKKILGVLIVAGFIFGVCNITGAWETITVRKGNYYYHYHNPHTTHYVDYYSCSPRVTYYSYDPYYNETTYYVRHNDYRDDDDHDGDDDHHDGHHHDDHHYYSTVRVSETSLY